MMISQDSCLAMPTAPCGKRTWYLVGIGGSGMRSFAEMLADAGDCVIGMDQGDPGVFKDRPASTGRVDIVPWNGLPGWNRDPLSVVVHSLAVSPLAPVLVNAVRNGLTVLALPDALSGFLKQTHQVGVAGTHGKTTTSGMIWWILNRAGKRPAGFVGGDLCGEATAGTFGAGRISVVESCEYRETFLSLNPRTVVLTGIEPDHFDCFQDDVDADNAFRKFIEKVPPDGTVIVNSDNPRAVAVARSSLCGFQSYSLAGKGHWNAVLQPVEANGRTTSVLANGGLPSQSFVLEHQDQPATRVTIPLPGLHNVGNAVAAIMAAHAVGIPVAQAAEMISTFPGIRRRFEHRGTWNGIDLIDDYAHHPTAVAATLKTARTTFPRRRILTIFEPHQISRTQRLFDEFADALCLADECMILPVLPARESASAAACCRLSGQLVRRVTQSGGRAFLLANLDQVQGRLDHSGRPGDVVITMGAGRTHLIHDEIHRRLHRDSAA